MHINPRAQVLQDRSKTTLSSRVSPQPAQPPERDLYNIFLIPSSMAHKTSLFSCSFLRLPHIPYHLLTGMLTAQNKPALILWISFLKERGKKNGRKSSQSLLKRGEDPETQRGRRQKDLGETGWPEGLPAPGSRKCPHVRQMALTK